MGSQVSEKDLVAISLCGEGLDDSKLAQRNIQERLLECCKTETAHITLLYYLVVVRGVAVRFITPSVKVINGSRRYALAFERERSEQFAIVPTSTTALAAEFNEEDRHSWTDALRVLFQEPTPREAR